MLSEFELAHMRTQSNGAIYAGRIHTNLVGNFHCQRVEAGVFLSQLNALGEVGLEAVPLLSQLDHFRLDVLSLLQHNVVNET
jgi:hypothetical protein